MKNKILARIGAGLIVLAAAGLIPLPAFPQNSPIGYKKDILISPQSEQNQLFTWGGTVNIEGKVRKDVLAVGSEVTISGEVGDSFVGVGARVTLKPTAVIRKDLLILGGTLVREEGSVVQGDTVYFKSEELRERFLQGGVGGLLGAAYLPIVLIIKIISLAPLGRPRGHRRRSVPRKRDPGRRRNAPLPRNGPLNRPRRLRRVLFLMVFAAVLSVILIRSPS